jgi:nucleoside-diphosphate-sugar epimerase
MMSSRTVYGPALFDGCLRESDKPAPQTPYARNKLHIEQRLSDRLKDRLTILRGANVFGHEMGRKSFFGMALASLKSNRQIVFDMNPAVKRDFLAVWHVADALGHIAASPKPGLYNLGSGYGTACRDIASWIIKGYGNGKIISTNDDLRDDFYLDMTKTKTAFKLPVITPAMMRQDCIDCGKTLTGWQP